MGRGRAPKAVIDTDVNHMPPKELKAREEATPIYKSQEFIAPETLSTEEKVIWDRLVVIFKETTNCMVSDADADLMELYCRAKATADLADQKIKEDPRPIQIIATGKKKDGTPQTTAKANPWYKIRTDNSLLCKKLFEDLGLSPVARARMGVGAANAKKEENIFADIMNRSDD